MHQLSRIYVLKKNLKQITIDCFMRKRSLGNAKIVSN